MSIFNKRLLLFIIAVISVVGIWLIGQLSGTNQSLAQEVAVTIRINTDKQSYNSSENIKFTIHNYSSTTTYVLIGPCGLSLELYNGDWKKNPAHWSGCPSCGYLREIPTPIFLLPGASSANEWDQNTVSCEDGRMQQIRASGRYRFVLQYAEDLPNCHSAFDPRGCWLRFTNKEWMRAFSNEFSIQQ